MSGTVINESLNSTTHSNNKDPSVIQMRLDSQFLIENFELFLKNEKIVIKQGEDGAMYEERQPLGNPRANISGVQSILTKLQGVINSAVVQGNFTTDKPGISYAYENYIYELDVSFTKEIVNNQYRWDISDEDLEGICDQLMCVAIPFMTRLIDNKERESYGDTIVHRESKSETGRSGIGFA